MQGTVDQLVIELSSEASSAASGFDAVIAKLQQLKTAVGGTDTKVGRLVASMSQLSSALNGLNASNATSMAVLADSLQKLSSVKSLRTLAGGVQSLGSALGSIDTASASGITRVAAALGSVGTVSGSGLSSAVRALRGIPDVVRQFSGLNISAFTAQVNQLSAAIGPLASSVRSLASAWSALPSSLRTVGAAARTVASANRSLALSAQTASRGLSAQASSAVSLGVKLTALGGTVRLIAGALASLISQANNYIEDMNLFQASMGSAAESAAEFAQQCQNILGIDMAQWMRNQGVFQTLITGLGQTSENATVMSQQLTQLGYDISSFFNIPVEDAMLKLQSGIAGELEPLRRIGWDLSEARMAQDAWKYGIEDSIQTLTQSEKVLLRYEEIMNQVTIVHGDMARTITSPANQLRVLQMQASMAARAIGNLFIPMLNLILPVCIAAVRGITMLAQAIANLFGIDVTFEVDYSGLDTSGIASGAEAMDDLADSAGGADAAAKELKRTIMGFDEINKLNDASSSSGSGGSAGSAGAGGAGVDLSSYDFFQGLSEKADELGEKMYSIFSRLLPIVVGVGAGIAAWKIGSSVSGFITAFKALEGSGIVGKIGTLLSGYSPKLMLASAAVGVLVWHFGNLYANSENFRRGLEVIGGFIDNLKQKAGELAGKFAGWFEDTFGIDLEQVWSDVTGFFDGLDIEFSDLAVIGLGVGAILTGHPVLGGILLAIEAVTAAIRLVGWAFEEVTDEQTGETMPRWQLICRDIGRWWEETKNSIVTWWNGVCDWFDANVWQPIENAAQAAGYWIGWFMEDPLGAIQSLWEGLGAWFDTNVMQPVSEAISPFVEDVKGFFEGAKENALNAWSGVCSWFGTNIGQPLSSAFSSLGESVGEFMSDPVGTIEGAWNDTCTWFDTTVASPVHDLFDQLSTDTENFWVDPWGSIQSVWQTVESWFDTNVVQPLDSNFGELWDSTFLGSYWSWSDIKSAWASASSWFDSNITGPIGEFFSGAWDTASTKASEAWEGIKQIFEPVVQWFKDTFGGAWDAVVAIINGDGGSFQTLKDSVFNSLKGVVNSLIGGINSVVAAPFNAINGAFDAIRYVGIEGLGFYPFSGLPYVPVPSIPYLASGGTVDSGQLFVARESGPEFVGTLGGTTAVANNEQIVAGIEQGVLRAMMQAASATRQDSGGTVEIPVYIGSEEIARAVWKGESMLERRGVIKSVFA